MPLAIPRPTGLSLRELIVRRAAITNPDAIESGIAASGLVYRFRAADLAGPPAAGAVVPILPDSSGAGNSSNGFPYTSTGATYAPTGLGGKPAVSCSGANAYQLPSMTRQTVIMVVKPADTENPNFTDYRRLFGDVTDTDSVFGMSGGAWWSPRSFPQTYNHSPTSLRHNGSDSPATISPLNVPMIVSMQGNVPLTNVLYLFVYGGGFVQQWKGMVAEILIWNRKLSIAEQQAAERTLGQYYGIAVRS